MAVRRNLTSVVLATIMAFLLPAASLAASIASAPACPVTDNRCTCIFDSPFYTLRCTDIAEVDDFDAIVGNTTEGAVILELDSLKWDFFPLETLKNSSVHTLLISNSTFRSFRESNSSGDDISIENLHQLSLENVTFQQVPQWDEFSSLTNLQVFFTHNTTLPEVISSNFSRYMSKSLEAITISKSNLVDIETDAFKDLKNLTLLRINHSSITRFEPHALPKPCKLEQLRLDNNKIHSLPDGVFDGLLHLNLVSLSNNTFSTLPKEVFGLLWNNETHVELRDNPLKCDCRMLWIVSSETKPSDIVGTCAYPKRLFGRNIKDLTAQDLDCFLSP